MDVVVHTSDWEGLPRVVAQGLIAGKPVVTFRLDGAPEVCVDGVTGFLVEHRNVPQLSAAMIRLGTQPDLCRQFGDEGQRRFSGQFRHEFMTSRIREIYRQVLDRRAVRGR
jgi:glycosyltransferase involved in cell wall biosynthesis